MYPELISVTCMDVCDGERGVYDYMYPYFFAYCVQHARVVC